MKVNLVKKQTIEDFKLGNPRSRIPFDEFLAKIKLADWNTPDDIPSTFRSADLLGNGSSRVVFDIGGNHYRMICRYAFKTKEVHLFIKWIGTHDAYNDLCGTGKRKKKRPQDDDQYTVNHY